MTTETGPTSWTTLDSPIGPLLITAQGGAITRLWMSQQRHQASVADPSWVPDPRGFDAAATQLAEYFAGQRTTFELPLAPVGTAFQLAVWTGLRSIPYGTTMSYGELAAELGQPGAARAVGLANGRNPISIVIPCHRVIGSTGTLTGYGGGLARKQWLLDLERGVGQLYDSGSGSVGFAQ